MTGPKFKKTILSNGACLITEKQAYSKAFCFGAWVLKGTRHEPENLSGICHFLEHLVFKGTKRRTSFEIASSLENLGGDLNAYTTKEYSCYHALALKEHHLEAVDVILDLITGMSISEKDFELEKKVILQEMAMSLDNYEDLAHEIFFDLVYEGHPLARRILGSEKSISSMAKSQVVSFYKEIYSPENFVFAASGFVDHGELEKQIEKYFSHRDLKKRFRENRQHQVKMQLHRKNTEPFFAEAPPQWRVVREVLERPTEQVQIVLGFPVPSFKDHHRFESFILNAYLGGGMTSTLFQSVREKTGLVYNIQSSLNTHRDCGCLMVYASTEAANVKKVIGLISDEFNKVMKKGVSSDFIRRLKTQVSGQILLGSDDVENRMSSLGINEMVFGDYRPVEQVIREINAVTKKTMDEFIRTKMDLSQISGVLVGRGVKSMKGWWKNAF
jgi:predicted Zn-dependent peptidase